VHLGGGDVPPDMGTSKAPALVAVELKTVILILIELLVANPGQRLAHLGKVRPAFANDDFALLELDFLSRGAEVDGADAEVDA
jgi:hypothetical protein